MSDHMKPKPPPPMIDQRQQQSDPAGQHRQDVNEAAKSSRKQPGKRPHPPATG